VQGCTYGCLGFADCVEACNYGAVQMVNGLAKIDYDKCVGCGACERACPRHIISMIPFKAERMLVVACSNRDPGRLVKQVCKVGCIGCKLCQKTMDIFEVADNLSCLNYEKYDPGIDFAEVLAKCPMQAMVYIGEPSPKDLAAVADETLPDRITDKFETTADKTQWRG
ncbi:MAG: 4Fe-4S binding protein, partial [Planctomycetes bacterium]|nr:4Fe-4S binding protein [Planctomycetota bacterium]